MHFANLLFVIPFTAVFAWPLALTHHTCAALVKKPDCKNPSIVDLACGACPHRDSTWAKPFVNKGKNNGTKPLTHS
ncbi:hypothetical protein H634G_02715 [Metarhizium anisopliae BRIP 53293]|uniref:Secreted protein n=1 Tax=Metarhizium anisopliae BRIP 53293 TaxID=1291518 RepID=A0A0D9P598_METAN|nr:hypothetical protein H634G_02715 [Metarhizium anisopliae BRIP 53293]KJK94135.1 hypothetical protein H633G_02007 [Metarhizium anisopliae BRIP 53284]